MERLKHTRLMKNVTVTSLLFILTIGRMLRSLWRSGANRTDRGVRSRLLARAIDRYSVARKLSVGTEVIFTNERTGGVWAPVTDVRHEVSGEALTEMAALIAELP
jgi:hypothetical protein